MRRFHVRWLIPCAVVPCALLLLAAQVTHAEDSAELTRFLTEAPKAWAEAEKLSPNVLVETTAITENRLEDREWTDRTHSTVKVRGKLFISEMIEEPQTGKSAALASDFDRQGYGSIDGINEQHAFKIRRVGDKPWKVLVVRATSDPAMQAQAQIMGRGMSLLPWRFEQQSLAALCSSPKFHLERVEELNADDRKLVKVSFTYARDKEEFGRMEGGWFALDPARRWSMQSWQTHSTDRRGEVAHWSGSIEYRESVDVIPLRSQWSVHRKTRIATAKSTIEFVKFERRDVPAEEFRPEAYGVETPPESRIDRDGFVRDIYGRAAPELRITDTRGIAKDFKLAGLRGKWVLLEFWGPECIPCLEESLPALIKFYDQHTADRDRFEILAVCVVMNDDGPKTIAQLEKAMAPAEKTLWGGRSLPFPIVMDDHAQTFKAYGIISAPAKMLIDPDGNVLKDGDEVLLAKKLAASKP